MWRDGPGSERAVSISHVQVKVLVVMNTGRHFERDLVIGGRDLVARMCKRL